jgi:REP element-mobilizing transposase RayT
MSDRFATNDIVPSRVRQLELDLPTWGGRRKRAGRKTTRARALVSHRAREKLRPGWAVHVTLRVRDHVWNLRSRRCFSVIERAFAAARERFGMRLVHFSVQGNHIHLLIETTDNHALARGMQGLSIRIAKALNRVMRRRGPVFADHYHSRVVRTPTEAARALEYVLRNFAHHAHQWGKEVSSDETDPYSSASRHGADPPPVCEPRTWLLSVGWRRGGVERSARTPRSVGLACATRPWETLLRTPPWS